MNKIGNPHKRLRFLELDALRGLMAIYVVLNHVINIGFGAAMLFAMLSSFLMTHVYSNQIKTGKTGFFKFAFLRIAKFYPLFIITTIVMITAILFGPHNFPHPHGLSTISVSLHNLFMIDYSAIWGASDGTGWWTMINMPAWSLCVLLWMNILILWPIIKKQAWIFNCAICFIMGLLMIIIPDGTTADIPILKEPRTMQMIFSFTIGILVYRVYDMLKNIKTTKTGLIITYILTFVGFAYFTPLSNKINPLVSILYFGVLMFMLAIYHGQIKILIGRVWSFFAKISFGVFLVHWPILYIMLIYIPYPHSFAITVSVMALTIPLAWLLYKYVEMPCYNWAKTKIK